MLTPRPLVLALLVTLGSAFATPSIAAPKAKAKAPAISPACTDFYTEANKDWLQANTMPASGAISVLGQLNLRAQQQQQDLLNNAMQAPQNQVQKLLGDFWASGLDEAAIERDGAAPVAPLLKRIDAIRKSKDIAPALAALHQVGIPVAFHFGADIDLRDLNRHLGYFEQGGIGLPDPAYYSRSDADTQALISRYADYIRKILALTGVQQKDIETQTAQVLDIEKRLAAAARPLSELRDPRNNFAPVPVAGLNKQYKNLLPETFLQMQGVSDDTVSMANPAMFAKIDALIGSLKPSHWQAYLRWRVGDAMAPYLAKSWRDAAFNFRGTVLHGQSEPLPRWQQTLDAINLAAGPMLGHEYAAAYLSETTRKQTESIADQVRAALQEKITRSTVISEAGKQEATEKLARLRIEVGTPKYDLDYSIQPMGRGSFGSNMLIASTWRHAQEMKRIGNRNALRRWDVLPQQPALAYDLAHNRLIVTAAMLQSPVFDAATSPAYQLGAFGALVGHELSHAVDNRGRHVDANGQVRDWWSASETALFDDKLQRMTALYAAQPYPGVVGGKLNGELTRDENFGDLVGLELAHVAFLATHPANNTAAQKEFFTAWARLWAQQVTADEAEIRHLQDVRSPGVLRANIPLMQQPAFGTAFGCKVGQPMQPKEQLRILD